MNHEFEPFLDHVIAVERYGLVDDPDDPGGLTHTGITIPFMQSVEGYENRDIRSLTREDVIYIYHYKIWSRHRLYELPQAVAWCLGDAIINHGKYYGSRLCQRALNVTHDGKFGPNSRKAAWEIDQVQFWQKFIEVRTMKYINLATKRPKSKKYVRGWINRNTALSANLFRALPNETVQVVAPIQRAA